MRGQTKILGNELMASKLWDDHVSVPARWLFVCLLLKTNDRGEIVVDEDYRVCSEISGLGIQSAHRSLTELQKMGLIAIYDDDTIVVRFVDTLRDRQTEKQAKAADRVRRWRERTRTEKVTGDVTSDGIPPHTPPLEISSTSTGSTSTDSTSSTSTVQDSGRVSVPSSVTGDEEKPVKPKKTDAQIRQETGFDLFWDAYGKKTGTKTALTAWKNLTKKDRAAAMAAVGAYVAATPDVQYRKNPTTWIHQRCWQDEMIAPREAPEDKQTPEAGEIDF
jgi:hypothetical protein